MAGRTFIYDGLAQNDVDMANHRLLNLDTSNLPPVGIPPTISLPPNQWLHGWDASLQIWSATRPTFADIGPDNGTLTSFQQQRISAVGNIRIGQWNGTPLGADRVPALDMIRAPSGNVSMAGKRLINVATPVDPGDAVNLGYMDFMLQGLVPVEAVRCASPGSGRAIPDPFGLDELCDGVPLQDGDRVLLYQMGTGREYEEGIWIAREGAWDRAPDTLGATGLQRIYCTVLEGDLNAGNSYVQTAVLDNNPPLLGDIPNFILFSSTPGANISGGAGLTKDGNALNVGGTPGRIHVGADNVDIDAAYAGQNSIVTVGVIINGTWNGDILDSAFGGTGQDNQGHIIHLDGDLSVVNPGLALGAGLMFQVNGFSSVLVPPSGTLATLSQLETFSNKRIVRRVQKINSNSKPNINVDLMDVFCITGLVEAITSITMTGTPTDRQQLEFWIKEATGAAGPGQPITWPPTIIDSSDLPLPAKTTPDMQMFLVLTYNSELQRWVLTQKLDNIA